MNDANVSEAVCQARQQLQAERMNRDKERLDKTEELLAEVSRCAIKLTDITDAHEKKLAEHEKRLGEIEQRPRTWIDKVIAGVIAAAVTFIMGLILK